MVLKQWRADLPQEWKKALVIGALAAALTAIFSLFIPDQFKSEASILPDRSRSSALGSLGDLSKAPGLSTILGNGAEGKEASFPDILVSRWVCERLLQKEYEFHTRVWRFGAWRPRKQTLFAYLDEPDIDRAVDALLRNYTADKVQRANIIALTVTTVSPELSQQVMEESLRLLDQFLHHEVQSRGKVKSRFSADRVEVAKTEYLSAENELKNFAGRNKNYMNSPDPGVRLEGQRLENLLKLRGDLMGITLINHEHALLEAADDTAATNVLDRPNLPIRKTRPARSMLVLLWGFLAAAGYLVWAYRRRILFFLRERGA